MAELLLLLAVVHRKAPTLDCTERVCALICIWFELEATAELIDCKLETALQQANELVAILLPVFADRISAWPPAWEKALALNDDWMLR